MRKFIFAVLALVLFVSCYSGNEEQKQFERISSVMAQRYSTLVEIEFNGEKHEYVYLNRTKQGSLAHWESCKYCK